jgi:uncharacterized protein (TIGR02594 family)
MIFMYTARIVDQLVKPITKLLLCLTVLHLAVASFSTAALARPHGQVGDRRPVHHVGRRPIAAAPFAKRRVAFTYHRRSALRADRRFAFTAHRRFAGRPHIVARRFARFAERQPALTLRAVGLAQAPAPAFPQGVIGEAMRYLGASNVTGTRGAWCADYASMVLRHTGHRPLASRKAASALAYGPRVGQPRPGDLVVVNTRAGYAAHVGFFAGWDHGRVLIVSGNWGHRVARAAVYQGAVAAYIRV